MKEFNPNSNSLDLTIPANTADVSYIPRETTGIEFKYIDRVGNELDVTETFNHELFTDVTEARLIKAAAAVGSKEIFITTDETVTLKVNSTGSVLDSVNGSGGFAIHGQGDLNVTKVTVESAGSFRQKVIKLSLSAAISGKASLAVSYTPPSEPSASKLFSTRGVALEAHSGVGIQMRELHITDLDLNGRGGFQFIDYDRDGDQDLFIVRADPQQGKGSIEYYENNGNLFSKADAWRNPFRNVTTDVDSRIQILNLDRALKPGNTTQDLVVTNSTTGASQYVINEGYGLRKLKHAYPYVDLTQATKATSTDKMANTNVNAALSYFGLGQHNDTLTYAYKIPGVDSGQRGLVFDNSRASDKRHVTHTYTYSPLFGKSDFGSAAVSDSSESGVYYTGQIWARDLNGDSRDEQILMDRKTGALYVSFQNSDGTSSARGDVFANIALGAGAHFDFVDLDGDSDVDLVYRGSNGALSYYTNVGAVAKPKFHGMKVVLGGALTDGILTAGETQDRLVLVTLTGDHLVAGLQIEVRVGDGAVFRHALTAAEINTASQQAFVALTLPQEARYTPAGDKQAVRVTIREDGGATLASHALNTLSVDFGTPVVTSAVLFSGDDTGTPGDGVTTRSTFRIQVETENARSVEVRERDSQVASVEVDSRGFAWVTLTDVAAGSHAYTVHATSPLGAVSVGTTLGVTVAPTSGSAPWHEAGTLETGQPFADDAHREQTGQDDMASLTNPARAGDGNAGAGENTEPGYDVASDALAHSESLDSFGPLYDVV